MASRIQIRRDTTANWAAEDPILAQGEFGFDTDTGAVKLGDGATAWSSLAAMTTAGELADYLLKTGGTATNLLLNSYREKTGTASSGAITMADGPVQDLTLTANTTLSFSDMQDGQNVTLHVLGLDSGWTLAFPVGAKTPMFPDLSAAAEAVFQIWKRGTQIYVSYPQVYS